MTGRTVIDIDNRIGLADVHAGWQNGSLWVSPNVRKVLPYTIIGGDPTSVAAGAAALDTMLHTECALGPVDAYGHSVAGETICKWLRDYGPTSTLSHDPADLRFLIGGNPEHRYNGHDKASTGYNLYGGNGYPLTTPFSVWEMVRQYDFYGDYPSTPSNVAAWENINGKQNAGIGYTAALVPRGLPIGPGFLSVHTDYKTTPFFDPGGVDSGYVTYTDPSHTNLHYIYARTYPLAMLQSVKWLKFWARSQDKAKRAGIEAAYSARPAPIPVPLYNI